MFAVTLPLPPPPMQVSRGQQFLSVIFSTLFLVPKAESGTQGRCQILVE